MIMYRGLTYTNLSTNPTWDEALCEAKASRVSIPANASWDMVARLGLLAVMQYWRVFVRTRHSEAKEQKLLLNIKAMILEGIVPPSLTYDQIIDGCIGQLDTERNGGRLSASLYHLRHAVCYLAYGHQNRNNQGGQVSSHITRMLAALPPTSVDCLDCRQTYQFEQFVGQRMHSERMAHATAGTRYLCQRCIDEHWVYSPHQEVYLNQDDETVYLDFISGPVSRDYANRNFYMEEDEDTGEETWYQSPPDTASLCSYSGNPFDFNVWDSRNSRNALVFGVELEMEPTEQSSAGQRELVKLLGGSRKNGNNYILKSDGSLNNGVELVTMPFTLEQHKEGKVVKWEKLLSAVNRGKAMSGAHTTRCGMHVHINKAALSALTIGKMLVFLNSETLSPLISSIAQRSSSSYCSRDSGKKIVDGARQSSNRYDILNVSGSHPTCEVRMFRGNLRPERVFKNLEFCHALVQYCRQTSLQDLSDWGNFSRWLVKMRGLYSHLVQFLADNQTVGFRALAREPNEHYSPAAIQEV